MSKTALIVGGTGQIGIAIAQRLLEEGWRVSVTHRGNSTVPPSLVNRGAKSIIHDRAQTAGLSSVVGDGADVLIDTIAFDARHADQLLEVQGAIGSLLVISSSSVYCDSRGRTLDEGRQNGFPNLPRPMTETQTTVPPGNATYSTRKVALERQLLAKATTPVTILRPCAIHGPSSSHPREWWFVKRMLDGRAIIPLAYRGQSRFHTTAVANVAGLTSTVLANPSTQILNIGDDAVLTVAEIGETVGRYLSYTGRFEVIDDDTYPTAMGLTPWSVPSPFMLDNSAAKALGFSPLSYAATIAATLDYLVRIAESGDWQDRLPIFRGYTENPFDYAAEDVFLGRNLAL